MTFKKWMTNVDNLLSNICSLTSNDLADWCYRDAYEAEYSIEDVVCDILEENGYPYPEQAYDNHKG